RIVHRCHACKGQCEQEQICQRDHPRANEEVSTITGRRDSSRSHRPWEEASPKKSEASVKEVKVSTTDPESGLFVKGEKERVFAYSFHTACTVRIQKFA